MGWIIRSPESLLQQVVTLAAFMPLLMGTEQCVGVFFTREFGGSDLSGDHLVAIAVLASLAGSALRFLFRYLGLDPALMSAPFITTAVNVIGVLIYFRIARLMLGL